MDLLGYARDLIAAVIGLAILFGAGFTDAQVTGLLLVVSTAGALATYVYSRYQKGDGSAAGESK